MDPSIAIVANRGPNDFVWRDGRWAVRKAAGGLVSLLQPLARRPNVVWYCCVSEPPDARLARQGLFTTAADQTEPRLHVVPVPLPADIYHDYYGRISNEVLWMLQHHVIGAGGYDLVDQEDHRAWREGYLEANRRLAAAISASQSAPDAFLVQDYHLYPMPALLRAAFPETSILHFTHIPFPDPPVLRLLPRAWRDLILNSLLQASVVGLQTAPDVRAFLASCEELLGLAVDPAEGVVVAADGRRVRVRAYPASVDPRALHRTMQSTGVERSRRRLDGRSGRLNVVRVDRLDPSKNQIAGFLAFARLLELRPELCGSVRFLAFLVPSRTDLGAYRAYHDTIYETIEQINTRFSAACGGPPVEIFYSNDRDQALAAMESCDVLLINSLEDGMNLVAKEWAVVSQRPGALIVSETAGVAWEAADSALLISPRDVEGTARAMLYALEMPHAERLERLYRLRQRVRQWTGADWLSSQLRDLGLAAGVG